MLTERESTSARPVITGSWGLENLLALWLAGVLGGLSGILRWPLLGIFTALGYVIVAFAIARHVHRHKRARDRASRLHVAAPWVVLGLAACGGALVLVGAPWASLIPNVLSLGLIATLAKSYSRSTS